MAGQLIVLPGVTAAAAGSAPRVNMNAADSAAAKITALKHAVSARSLSAVSGGGVAGRCRATGALLIPKGTAGNLSLTEVAGMPALAAANSSGLALPPGSLTRSYTLVAAVAISSVDSAAGLAVNLLAGMDGSDAYISTLLRYYGAAAASPNSDVFASTGSGTTVVTATPRKARPSGNWAIAVVDLNFNTKVLSLALNDVASPVTQTLTAPIDPSAASYIEIGYHLSAGLSNSKIGDLYTFNASLLSSDLGKTQLADLVSALKSTYGIA